jgi:hypothetical protein
MIVLFLIDSAFILRCQNIGLIDRIKQGEASLPGGTRVTVFFDPAIIEKTKLPTPAESDLLKPNISDLDKEFDFFIRKGLQLQSGLMNVAIGNLVKQSGREDNPWDSFLEMVSSGL